MGLGRTAEFIEAALVLVEGGVITADDYRNFVGHGVDRGRLTEAEAAFLRGRIRAAFKEPTMLKSIIDDALLAVEAGATIAQLLSKIIDGAHQANLLTDAEVADLRADHARRFAGPAYRTDDQLPNPSA